MRLYKRIPMSTLPNFEQQSNSRHPSISGLTYPARRRLWSWLINRLPFLRRRFSSATDIPPMPNRDEDFEAKLLAALCEAETREAILRMLNGEAMGLATSQQEGGKNG